MFLVRFSVSIDPLGSIGIHWAHEGWQRSGTSADLPAGHIKGRMTWSPVSWWGSCHSKSLTHTYTYNVRPCGVEVGLWTPLTISIGISSINQKIHLAIQEASPCMNKHVIHIARHMEVSWNRGTPKSSILMVFFIINHPTWDISICGNPHMKGSLYSAAQCFIYRSNPFPPAKQLLWRVAGPSVEHFKVDKCPLKMEG